VGANGDRRDGVRIFSGEVRPVPEDRRPLACRQRSSDYLVVRTDFGGAVGAALIIAGMVMVVLATIRFAHTRRAIDSVTPGTGTVAADLALAVMMTALGVALLLYLVHSLTNGI
jgi:hypothetical protein